MSNVRTHMTTDMMAAMKCELNKMYKRDGIVEPRPHQQLIHEAMLEQYLRTTLTKEEYEAQSAALWAAWEAVPTLISPAVWYDCHDPGPRAGLLVLAGQKNLQQMFGKDGAEQMMQPRKPGVWPMDIEGEIDKTGPWLWQAHTLHRDQGEPLKFLLEQDRRTGKTTALVMFSVALGEVMPPDSIHSVIIPITARSSVHYANLIGIFNTKAPHPIKDEGSFQFLTRAGAISVVPKQKLSQEPPPISANEMLVLLWDECFMGCPDVKDVFVKMAPDAIGIAVTTPPIEPMVGNQFYEGVCAVKD